ncbi:helix-turn-helix domain-containing protein [Flavobacterium seoulense]|uniref:AraC family transcriptional regulator n=1 Tax=Flavobacterium seoulense TaxID=1492738 RepID=A0A066WL18_9FLAO|nr:AraC family transcriptional regulator [Flavobacterium seoulense]KDN54546.1 AraC family transcriptional regulator [Flavobacterium seoulense]
MKTISITSNYLYSIFEQIQAQLGGNLDKKSKEYRLEINNDTGKGFISGIMIEPAICYIEYEIIFKEDVSFVYKQDNSSSIHFGYCSNGCLMQSFGEEGKRNRLNQFQTGIFSNSFNKKNTIFSFNKNQPTKASLITVHTLSVHDQELKQQLISTFFQNKENHPLSYVGSLNLKIVEQINLLNSINQKGLVRNLLINSSVYLILALEIEQHKYDLTKAQNCFNSALTQVDMEIIKRVSEHIKMNPEIQYSLKYLCKKFGISPFKLQEGFKVMHDRTVTDFIRNTRVEVAENLIRTSELNISEIVYTVGLTSRSYFSKIFKEKYNCSPKHYQNHQNKVVITA